MLELLARTAALPACADVAFLAVAAHVLEATGWRPRPRRAARPPPPGLQVILKLVAGNGASKVVVGKDAIMATPAMSALIRRRGLYGGLIMSASHNPGGPGEERAGRWHGAA